VVSKRDISSTLILVVEIDGKIEQYFEKMVGLGFFPVYVIIFG
jgi:hypothetical protein